MQDDEAIARFNQLNGPTLLASFFAQGPYSNGGVWGVVNVPAGSIYDTDLNFREVLEIENGAQARLHRVIPYAVGTTGI